MVKKRTRDTEMVDAPVARVEDADSGSDDVSITFHVHNYIF